MVEPKGKKKTTKGMLLVLALALACGIAACGGGNPAGPNPGGSPAPPPPVVCSPQFPPTLVPGWTLQTGRAVGETVLREKASIRVTFAWSPPTAPTGAFVMLNVGYFCPEGKPCEGALAPDYTPKPSPRVIQTQPLEPGSYFVVLENLSTQGISIDTGTVVEICK